MIFSNTQVPISTQSMLVPIKTTFKDFYYGVELITLKNRIIQRINEFIWIVSKFTGSDNRTIKIGCDNQLFIRDTAKLPNQIFVYIKAFSKGVTNLWEQSS